MRKSQLRQQVDNHLRHNHTGSYREKKHRYFVLHKIIRDLYHIKCIPGGTWHALTFDHVQRLVAHWKSNKLKPSTIMTRLYDFFTNPRGLTTGPMMTPIVFIKV